MDLWRLFKGRKPTVIRIDGCRDWDEMFVREWTGEERDDEDLLSPGDHSMPRSIEWLQSFMRWAVAERATAVHFLYDSDEDCLRQLIYVQAGTEPCGAAWREAAPMVGWFARPALRDVGRLAGIRRTEARGILEFVSGTERILGVCVRKSAEEMVLYLTSPLPSLRTKAGMEDRA